MSETQIPLPEIGTPVRVIYKDQETDENWFAVPMSTEVAPEGFTLIEGRWGEVTGHDHEHKRSLGGRNPIVVVHHMYLGFDPNHWR